MSTATTSGAGAADADTAETDNADELRQIRAMVMEVLDEQADLRRTHEVMAETTGHDPHLHELLTGELGLLGLVVPERLGGLGLDIGAATAVVEELGARLVPGALSTSLSAILAARELGSGTDELLSRVVAEQLTLTCAIAEHPAGVSTADGAGEAAEEAADPWSLATTSTIARQTVSSATGADHPASGATGADHPASSAGQGSFVLTGTKTFVIGAEAARVVLVTARDESAGDDPGGLGVYAVDIDAPGVGVVTHEALDHTRRLSTITLRDAPGRRLDEPGGDGAQVLLDHLRAMLALEAAAAAGACLDLTVAYLKLREQFGRPIGANQALKHRCADLAVAVAGARATADHLVSTLRAGSPTRTHDAALAKLVCTDTLFTVAAEAIQLHGGIGFTFEHDAHLFFKRGKAGQLMAGTPERLRHEIAGLAGL